MPADKTFVIVGAGLAGAKAAEALRQEGFDGRLVLVGEESDRPYERPPLSKDYLRKETADKPYVHPESYYEDHGIELMTSTRVTELDTSSKKLVLDDERSIGYDRLLIATGPRLAFEQIPGLGPDGGHTLRSATSITRSSPGRPGRRFSRAPGLSWSEPRRAAPASVPPTSSSSTSSTASRRPGSKTSRR